MEKETEIAISVKNLSKIYQKKNTDGDKEDFCALKNINLEIKKGEVIGVIGENGSGKSTLLKILSGIYKPDTGEVEMYGSIASILDVGAGMRPELSGKKKIFLRGQLLGLSSKEIESIYDDLEKLMKPQAIAFKKCMKTFAITRQHSAV